MAEDQDTTRCWSVPLCEKTRLRILKPPRTLRVSRETTKPRRGRNTAARLSISLHHVLQQDHAAARFRQSRQPARPRPPRASRAREEGSGTVGGKTWAVVNLSIMELSLFPAVTMVSWEIGVLEVEEAVHRRPVAGIRVRSGQVDLRARWEEDLNQECAERPA